MWSRSQVSPQDQVFDAVLRWRRLVAEARNADTWTERQRARVKARMTHRQLAKLGDAMAGVE